jgi:hypothetical protein
MLVRNKFNGYQPDGRRVYPVGGGVGEAMLLGAAMGGGSAAITGGDPLKGALLGGITGGIGGGISSALPALNPGTVGAAASTAAPIAESIGQTAAQAALSNTAASPISQLGANAVDFAPVSAMNPTLTPSFGVDPLVAANTGERYAGSLSKMIGAAPPPPGGTFAEGLARFAEDPLRSLSQHKFLAGASALAGATGARPDMSVPSSKYSGPLKKFRFDPFSYQRSPYAEGGIVALAAGGSPARRPNGGISSLGSYSDGGRMLRGPGDGMSDSIPGVIGGKRPARLADGEFVVPADVVSGIGNGSTDAGARQLYAMMDKVRKARTGKKTQGREINARKYMPA